MASNHTPGKWRWEHDWNWLELVGPDGVPILKCMGVDEGNKRLIVEAPELYKALRWAMSIIDTQSKCDSSCTEACSNYRAHALLDRIDHE